MRCQPKSGDSVIVVEEEDVFQKCLSYVVFCVTTGSVFFYSGSISKAAGQTEDMKLNAIEAYNRVRIGADARIVSEEIKKSFRFIDGFFTGSNWRVVESEGRTSFKDGFSQEFHFAKYHLYVNYDPFTNRIIGRQLIELEDTWLMQLRVMRFRMRK